MRMKTSTRIEMLKWKLSLHIKRVVNFLNQLRMKKSALLAFIILFILVVMSIFPQLFSLYSPTEVVGSAWEPPSLAHPLGLDDVGRDVLSLLIYGTRTSMIVGFCVAFLAIVIGMPIGMLSAYYGGMVDNILMRITEFFLVIPSFPLMVILAFILKPSLQTVILSIVVVVWTQPVRIIRSEVLSLKERLYITRAKVVGNTNMRIISRYILPRVLPLAFSTMIMAMGWAIPSEAFLSWIGLGDPTNISWGTMLYYAFTRGAFTGNAWWHFIPPGIMILTVVIAFNILGHSMEEILNPKLRKTI
jgi:ABC-type dipeptide/oligopeptide/nickel transport system permease subunit